MAILEKREKTLYEMCYMGCALTHCISADFDKVAAAHSCIHT